MLWLIFGLMSLAAILAVLRPFVRNVQPIQSGNDVAVYRDQLEELERDLAAGLIRKSGGKRARLEISRRLLASRRRSRSKMKENPITVSRLQRCT